MAQCSMCRRALENPSDILSTSCGGDCILCMAEAGDPECVDEVIKCAKRGQIGPMKDQERADAIIAHKNTSYMDRLAINMRQFD